METSATLVYLANHMPHVFIVTCFVYTLYGKVRNKGLRLLSLLHITMLNMTKAFRNIFLVLNLLNVRIIIEDLQEERKRSGYVVSGRVYDD